MADRSEPCNCDQALELAQKNGELAMVIADMQEKLSERTEMLQEANKEITNLKRALDWSTQNVERLERELEEARDA